MVRVALAIVDHIQWQHVSGLFLLCATVITLGYWTMKTVKESFNVRRESKGHHCPEHKSMMERFDTRTDDIITAIRGGSGPDDIGIKGDIKMLTQELRNNSQKLDDHIGRDHEDKKNIYERLQRIGA